MKRFIRHTAIVLAITSCASSTAMAFESKAITAKTAIQPASAFFDTLVERKAKETLLERQARQAYEARAKAAAEQRQREANKRLVESVVQKLHLRIEKTRYVFSGHTPSGWDCSGLVYWTYQQLGIELDHSASKQGHSGVAVETPQIGDIVAFGYVKSKGYYHSAIYIGDGKVIHAGFKPGTKTEVISLDHPAFDGSRITFRRFIEIG